MKKLSNINWYKICMVTLCTIAAGLLGYVFYSSYFSSPKFAKQVTSKIPTNQKQSIESTSLNKILGNDLKVTYEYDKKPKDIPEAVGLNFELPDNYEIAISKPYPSNYPGNFRILGLRQIKSNTLRDYYPVEIEGKDAYIPVKPIMVAIVDENNIIIHLVILSDYPFFQGNETFDNYNAESINKSIELKDLDADGTQEILIYSFKPYTADSLNSLLVISLNKSNNQKELFKSQKYFKVTYKEGFGLVERKGKYFIIEAESGVGDCRLCNTVYTIHIQEFTNFQSPTVDDDFLEVATLVSEKEFESGEEAINYKMLEINNKLDRYLK